MGTKTMPKASNYEKAYLQAGNPGTERALPETRKAGLAARRLPLLAAMTLATVFALHLPMAEAADGDLDPSFGIGGLITTDFLNSLDEAHAVAIQSDGRIVVAGTTSAVGDFDFALARYNPDGSLDSTFGVGGKAATDFANTDDIAFGVAIQNDGKIVVVGSSDTGPTFSDFALARYNADGSLDPSFGVGGKVLTDFENAYDTAFGVAIQSDGKIVVAGRAFTSATFGDFALVRYNLDGSLDSSFGLGGKVITDFADDYDQANAVTIQSDGKIVVAGFVFDGSSSSAPPRFGLARYDADGSLDVSFGSDGKVMTDFAREDSAALAVTLQHDGKIVAAGSAFNTNTFLDFALSRYNADGSLDASFGSGGRVTTDIADNYDEVNGVAIQSDGKIVVTGFAGPEFGLARYNVDGSLDVSFGAGGKVITDFEGNFDLGLGMALQADGNIVTVGRADLSGTGTDFGLARYQVTPTLPHTLRFYLHGNDTPGTASGFTMNQTPAPSQTLRLNLSSCPTWFSEPALTGTFQPGATFRLTMPRTLGLNVAMTFRLAVTNPDGSNGQLLGQTTQLLGLGLGARTINIPVTTPVTLNNRRLCLTMSSAANLYLNLQTGSSTFLELTTFTGTP